MSLATTLLQIQTATEKLQDNTAIRSVYSGRRPGCMCGCNGDWRYTRRADRPDWAVVNERQVTKVREIVLANLDRAKITDRHVYVELNRVYAVEFVTL